MQVIWEKLVFSKLRAKLGGRVRIMSSGASPISPEVRDSLMISSIFKSVNHVVYLQECIFSVVT
jgi:long-subunit acyl-CoA synthetase (AMP-forming)